MTISLPLDVENAYREEAQKRGLPVEMIVAQAVVAAKPRSSHVDDLDEMSPQDWMRRYKEWAEGPAHQNLPVLSDEAMSRESIYEDRGL